MNPVTRIRTTFRQRFRKFIDRRTPIESEAFLNHRRLYILPSKAGYGFLMLVAATWLLATNFENNLIFMLCFLLAALFVVSIHFTHSTLSGLSIKPVRAQSVFRGEAAAIELCFSQPSGRLREQISLKYPGGEPMMVSLDRPGDTFITVLAPAPKRGYLDPGMLHIESVSPVGMLKVWCYVHFRFDAAVWPAPVKDRPRASGRTGKGESHYAGTAGSEDYVGLKTYEVGEPLRHVAWKQYAREQGLWSKQYGDPLASEVWVDWDDYPGMDIEQRLSRMTWQVCEWSGDGRVFGLRLPELELAPNQGIAHQQSALRQLALFGISEPEAGPR